MSNLFDFIKTMLSWNELIKHKKRLPHTDNEWTCENNEEKYMDTNGKK